MTEQSYDYWRKAYGGLHVNQVKQMNASGQGIELAEQFPVDFVRLTALPARLTSRFG